MKKVGQTQKKNKLQCGIQITIFLHYLGRTLSDYIISLFRKILELEFFKLKVGTYMGGTLSGSKAISQIKPEPRTQTNCLKVLITLFLQD